MRLNEHDQSRLTEIVAGGAARAETALSDMLGGEIAVCVTHVAPLDPARFPIVAETALANGALRVAQQFDGPLDGVATLLLPTELVRAVAVILAGDEAEAILAAEPTFEQEAAGELGNVVLNACIGALANALHIELEVAPPDVASVSVDAALDPIVIERAASGAGVLARIAVEGGPAGVGAFVALAVDVGVKSPVSDAA